MDKDDIDKIYQNYYPCQTQQQMASELIRLTRFAMQARWQVDKEAIGLSRFQQFSSTCNPLSIRYV